MAPTLSQIAEELVRSGQGSSVTWQGKTLSTHFQPIYSVKEAECVGFEALIRVQNEAGDLVRPAKLFDEVFRDGDGVLLDWICRALHLRRFATVGPGDRKLFINVHPEAALRDARRAGGPRSAVGVAAALA